MRSKRWDELSPAKKVAVMLAVSVQVSLAVSAWSDLAQRPTAQIRGGRKGRWAAVIAVNFVGPLWYFWRGRVAAPPEASTPTR